MDESVSLFYYSDGIRTHFKNWISPDMDSNKFLLLISIFTNNRISLLSKQLPLVSSIRLLMVLMDLTMIPQADRNFVILVVADLTYGRQEII